MELVGPSGCAAVVLLDQRGEQSQNLCSLKIGNRIFLAQNRIFCLGRNTLELIAAVVELQEKWVGY